MKFLQSILKYAKRMIKTAFSIFICQSALYIKTDNFDFFIVRTEKFV